jgi:hypothetical protein
MGIHLIEVSARYPDNVSVAHDEHPLSAHGQGSGMLNSVHRLGMFRATAMVMQREDDVY